MFCSHEDFKPCKTEYALLLDCFIVAYGWRCGWLFWASNVDFCCWAFFLLQTQLSKLMFFSTPTHSRTKKETNPKKHWKASGEHGFRPGLSCAHFFPRTDWTIGCFTKKITGVTVLAHVDSCRKMDLKEVSEVEVPLWSKGVAFWWWTAGEFLRGARRIIPTIGKWLISMVYESAQ